MPDTQRIFAVATPTEGTTYEAMLPVLPFEAARTWELYTQGVAREVWLRTDGLGAVAVLESTLEEARALTDAFPMARAGLVTFDCVPVRPFTALQTVFGTQDAETPPTEPPARRDGTLTQKVLALLDQADAGTTDLAPLMGEEVRGLWALWKAGFVREPYLRSDGAGAVLVMEALDAAEATTMLAQLPFLRAGALSSRCMTVGAFAAWEALLQGGLPDAAGEDG